PHLPGRSGPSRLTRPPRRSSRVQRARPRRLHVRREMMAPEDAMATRSRRLVVLTAFAATVSLASAASDLTGRWVARVPNNDGTFRETVFVLDQQSRTLTGTVINPTSEQPFV